MAQSHKDGSTVKDILHQLQSQQDGVVMAKQGCSDSSPKSDCKPVKLRSASIETPTAFARPSIKQIPKNVVNQKSRLFEKSDTDVVEVAADEGGPFSQKNDSEKSKKPVPPKRPPLARKPPAAIERKPRVIGPKPKLFQDKDKLSFQDSEGGENSKSPSKRSPEADERINEEHSKDGRPNCGNNSSHSKDGINGVNKNKGKLTGQSASVESSECLYSKLDKTKKLKYQQAVRKVERISVEDAPSGSSAALDHGGLVDRDLDESLGGEYATLRVSQDNQDTKTSSQRPSSVVPQTDHSPIPPKKPPRTFAHDDYMMQKQLKQQQKKAARETQKRKGSTEQAETKPKTDEFGYEYISTEEVPKPSVKSQTIHRMPFTDDRTKAKQFLQKPLERPPPPPRPPPPSPKSTLSTSGVDSNKWKKPHVFVKEHNAKVPEAGFLAKRNVSNPSYEADWDIIRIKHPKSDAESISSGVLKKCKSDECLYVEPDVRHSEPIYMDPVDAIRNSQHNVILDAEGYAIPEEVNKPAVNGSHGNHIICRLNSTVPEIPVCEGQDVTAESQLKMSPNCTTALKYQSQARRKPVQEKLSKAYSVLRLNLVRSDESPNMNLDIKEDDSDDEVNPDEQNERLQYVSTVKLRLSMAVRQSPYRTPEELRLKLFNYAAIIGLEKLEEMSDEIEVISQFCFPDLQAWRPVTKYKSETFSFVLTDEHAKRRYGYCMRFLPPGTGNRLPVVLCIVSALDAYMFYKRLLDEIREKYKISMDHAELLIQAAYATPLPDPGKEAWVISQDAHEKRETIFLKRPADTRQDNVSFSSLLSCLSIDNLINVFASVLLERKIIFVAQHLSTLTSCIQAICALLYPFTWPHPYVPVLPEKMVEVCQSPTPIIVGVLTTQQPKLADLNLDHVLMIDLDHNTLMMCQGDESRIIPKKLQKALKLSLKDDGDLSTQAHDMLIMESFLRFFVETVGHYTEYICTQMDGEKIFEKKAFITSVSSKSIRMFLEWFVETQMFEVFITDKMESSNNRGTFEARIMEYREEMQDTPTIKQNVKEMGRRVKNFFQVSGDKIKKKFSSNVFI